MKRISKTRDPQGTIGAIGGATAVAVTSLALAFPPGLLLVPLAAFLVKRIRNRYTTDELDAISLENSNRIASTWIQNRQPGEKGATYKFTRWTDAPMPLPQTRIHHYLLDENEE